MHNYIYFSRYTFCVYIVFVSFIKLISNYDSSLMDMNFHNKSKFEVASVFDIEKYIWIWYAIQSYMDVNFSTKYICSLNLRLGNIYAYYKLYMWSRPFHLQPYLWTLKSIVNWVQTSDVRDSTHSQIKYDDVD